MVLSCLLMGVAACAAGKDDPVAAAYPDWTGLTAKNRIIGRELSPSDLRHKVTIVVELEATTNLQDHLVAASKLMERGAFKVVHGVSWEDFVLPRDIIALAIVHNVRSHESVKEALTLPKGADKTKTQALAIYGNPALPAQCETGLSIYEGVGYTGSPETAGKRPYVYVLGPAGREILAEGPINAATTKAVGEAIAKGKKEIAAWEHPWRRYIGNLPDEKVSPALLKALEKGRSGKLSPLEPIAKAALKGVVSKDEAVAREAQIQYDAIYQARGDLVESILLEATCPHKASYDITELLKYFPREKKRVEATAARILAKPEYAFMAKVFARMMEVSAPDFTCKPSEAKKIVQELNKMKKKLAPLKESTTLTIQNGALILDMKIDDLIPQIEAMAN